MLNYNQSELKNKQKIIFFFLKKGYELIQSVVPSCQQTDPLVSTRITRAITLEESKLPKLPFHL